MGERGSLVCAIRLLRTPPEIQSKCGNEEDLGRLTRFGEHSEQYGRVFRKAWEILLDPLVPGLLLKDCLGQGW